MPTNHWWEGALGVALLGLLAAMARRLFAAYTKSSSSEVDDRAKFREELMGLIRQQWARINEQDDTIAKMRREVLGCEEKHLELTARHDRLVVAVRKWIPHFEFEEEDRA